MMKALRRGQTMVEYIIIVALIAIALIAVFTSSGLCVLYQKIGVL